MSGCIIIITDPTTLKPGYRKTLLIHGFCWLAPISCIELHFPSFCLMVTRWLLHLQTHFCTFLAKRKMWCKGQRGKNKLFFFFLFRKGHYPQKLLPPSYFKNCHDQPRGQGGWESIFWMEHIATSNEIYDLLGRVGQGWGGSCLSKQLVILAPYSNITSSNLSYSYTYCCRICWCPQASLLPFPCAYSCYPSPTPRSCGSSWEGLLPTTPEDCPWMIRASQTLKCLELWADLPYLPIPTPNLE